MGGEITTAAQAGEKPRRYSGVISLIGSLIADLAKEPQKAKLEEDRSQKEYDAFMVEWAASRAQKVKEVELKDTREFASAMTSAVQTAKVMSALHQGCDWLIPNFDARKAARAVDALKSAKVGFVGADSSLLDVSRVEIVIKPMLLSSTAPVTSRCQCSKLSKYSRFAHFCSFDSGLLHACVEQVFLWIFPCSKTRCVIMTFYVHLSIYVSGFVDFFVCGSVAEFFHRDWSPNMITCRAAHRSTFWTVSGTAISTCDKKSCCCSLAEVMRRSGFSSVVAWTVPAQRGDQRCCSAVPSCGRGTDLDVLYQHCVSSPERREKLSTVQNSLFFMT